MVQELITRSDHGVNQSFSVYSGKGWPESGNITKVIKCCLRNGAYVLMK